MITKKNVMKATKFFLYAFAVLMIAACSDYEEGTDPQPKPGRALTFMFPNTATAGGGVTYAIATPNENELRTLDVYVFAQDELSTENPQPYLLEDIHQTGIGGFNLVQQQTNKKATVTLAKGNKKKFFFVGNGRDHIAAKDVTLNETRSDDFQEKVSQVQKGHIASPLLMTDLVIMNDVEAVVQAGGSANVELIRRMVRFDVDNDMDNTDFIIEEIRIKNARAAVNLFEDHATDYEAPFISDDLTVDFTLHANANHGLSKSVFYIYPTHTAGETTLELIGKDVATGNPQVYPVKMQDKQTADGTPFNIEANNRYTINILSKGIGYLEATLQPQEWDYDPDNDIIETADYGTIKLSDANGDPFTDNRIPLASEPTSTTPTTVKVAAENEWEVYIAPEYADWIEVTALAEGEIHQEFEIWTTQANPSGTEMREGVVEVRNKIRHSIMQPLIIRQAANTGRYINYSGAFVSNGVLTLSGEMTQPVAIDIEVEGTRSWSADAIKFDADDPDMDWINLNGQTYAQQTGPIQGNGRLMVQLLPNAADTVRQGYIRVTQDPESGEEGQLVCKIPVYQSPSNLGEIRLDAAGLKNDTLSVSAVGFSDRDGKRHVRVFAHTEWKVTTQDAWITITDKTFQDGYNGYFYFSVDRYTDASTDRTGEIKVENLVDASLVKTIRVTQKKLAMEIPAIEGSSFDFTSATAANWDATARVYDFSGNADGESFTFEVVSEKVVAYDFKLLYDVTGASVGLNDRNGSVYRNLIVPGAATDDGNGKKKQTFTINIPKQADDRRVPIDIQIFIRNSESYNYNQMITLRSRPDYNGLAGLKPVKVGGIFWAPVNVGATTTDGSATASLASWGYHFQYGRNKGFDPEKTDYEKIAAPVSYASIGPSGENEDKFITTQLVDDSDWLDKTNGNDLSVRNALWSKSVNDSPCPKGWRLPDESEAQIIMRKYNQGVTEQNGRLEIEGDESGKVFYLALSGNKSRVSANILSSKTSYWLNTGVFLNIESNKASIGSGYYSYGYAIRCVQQ